MVGWVGLGLVCLMFPSLEQQVSGKAVSGSACETQWRSTVLGLCWTQELTTHPGNGPIRPYHLRMMRQVLASSDVRATPHTRAHTHTQKNKA